MTYKPVPVETARQIALKFEKQIVIILAHDGAHGLFHTTTYGVSAADKMKAADLGNAVTIACGGDLTKATRYSDFRHVDAAAHAQARDHLIGACDVADAALAVLLGVRDRFSHEMIQQAEAARLAIDTAKRLATEATRGAAGGDAPAPRA